MKSRSQNSRLLLASITLFIAAASCIPLGEASIFGLLPPQALYNYSDLVVTGTVSGISSRWGIGGGESSIVTVVSLEVDGVAKGSIHGYVIEFTYPGGRIGESMVWVEEQPTFEVGEHVLMYLVVAEPVTVGGNPSYALTTGTFMGKSEATGSSTIGGDGLPIPIVPVKVKQLVISTDIVLLPVIGLALVTFIVVQWLGNDK